MSITWEHPQPPSSQRASPAAFSGCPPTLWASDLVVSREGGAHVCSSGARTQSEAGPQVGQRPRVADRRLGCRTEPNNHEEPGLSDLRPLQWPRAGVGPYPQGEHGGPVG